MSESWRRWIPETIEPKPTGHTTECEDSELNVCICGKSKPVVKMAKPE